MIIAHLIHDMPSLRSCSLTCYSWYIAVVPHLYLTLSVHIRSLGTEPEWPNAIRRMHALGLLPLVENFYVFSVSEEFSPKLFNWHILHRLSALTNVQNLGIDMLDIPSLMPRIRRYFRPFLPTVRSLHLREPRGSDRQLVFFVGLFPQLENLSLDSRRFYNEGPKEDLKLIPPFSPPLRGELLAYHWVEPGFFQALARSFGGLRFRIINIFNVGDTRCLLRACAKTLQVLQLHSTDPLGEQFSLKYV